MITRREFINLSLLAGAALLTGCRPEVVSAPAETPGRAPIAFDRPIYWQGDERIAEWLAQAQTAFHPDFTPVITAPGLVESASEVETRVAVPLTGSAGGHVRRLILYDPESLVKVKFVAHFSPKVAVADVSTQIKMLSSSQLAAIAENEAGARWLGRSAPIQVAAEGCSAGGEPSRQIPDDVLRVKFRDAGPWVQADVRLHHPMVSGLSVDEFGTVSKVYEPFYANRLVATIAGETLVDFELTPGLSENTLISFALPRLGNEPLTVAVTNNEGGEYELKALILI